MPKWRSWQTRMVQVHVPARVWGFESLLRHQSFLLKTTTLGRGGILFLDRNVLSLGKATNAFRIHDDSSRYPAALSHSSHNCYRGINGWRGNLFSSSDVR